MEKRKHTRGHAGVGYVSRIMVIYQLFNFSPLLKTVATESRMEVHTTFVQGCQVTFPAGRKPFPAQLAVMSKVLVAAKERKHALLESPTGTGKVLLELLCIFLLSKLYLSLASRPLPFFQALLLS